METTKPKMTDVARLAGVSAATASRALRNQSLVRARTRERIKRVAEQLGYTPDAAARTLVSRRSRMIGLFAIMLTDYPFTDLLRGAMAGACARGYGLMLVENRGDTGHDYLSQIVQAIREGRVDGCLSYVDIPGSRRLADLAVPCVAVESYGVREIPSVCLDRAAAGYDLTRHFLDRGHRRIVMLGADDPSMVGLIAGYRRAFEERGMEYRPERILQYPSDTLLGVNANTPEGYATVVEAGVRLVMALAERPTALVFHFAQRAMVALRVLRRMGLRVPEDIAVAALADVPGSDLTEPALTVWKGDYLAVGRRGVESLIDRIEGKPQAPDGHVHIGGQLIVRESCGGKTI